jgi:PAS domain S-box-containing protein
VYLPFHPANLVEMITRARRERALLRAEDLLEIRTRDLRQSEERFRVLVDTMLDPLLILGFDGSLRFANPAAFSLLELPPQETFAGLSIHRFLTAEGQAQAKVDLLTIQRTGGPVMREYELRTGSGGGRLVEANGVRSIYGGEAVDVVCLRDVTERKRSEERTRSSESKFRELYSLLRLLSDTMPDMLWAKDLKKQYLFANKAVCAELLCATDTSEPLRKTDLFFADRERAAHPEDPHWHTFGELCQDSDAATLTAMREMEFHEFGNVRGRLLHLEVRKAPFYNHAGELIGVVGSARNITERVANEAKLKDVQQTHAEIFNTLTDAIYVHDRSGTIIAANKGAEVMYGLSREELIGLKPQDLAAPGKNDMVAVMSRTLAVFETGKSIQLEFWGRRKNGEDFPKEVIVNRGRYFGEEVLIVTARDASEKKKAEAERDKLQAQLIQAQKMEAIGRLAGGVAHDFNNMLQAIVGNAELAQVGITPDSPLFEPLQEVSKCAKRSADLTRQLLAFARKQAVSPKVIDLSVTVEGMLKMLRRLIGESVDLAWLPDRQEALVKIDPSQVDQILANLCVNARDAIRGVGQIRLATDILTLDEVQAEVHPDAVAGDYVRLMVSDTGCGMPPETMVRLFEPFFTTKEPGKGTGLGLATVYGIVRQNRGFITVRSAPGQGSTFAIHLPRHNAKPTGIEKRESAEPFHRGQGTILVVEDEPAILRLAKRALLGLGYTVLTATSPREALEIAAQYNGNIDLLLTDVIMPEMTGRELGEQLLASRPSLKRLYMSGYTADVIADHGALEAGVNFLQKPFSIAALGTKVRDTIVGN